MTRKRNGPSLLFPAPSSMGARSPSTKRGRRPSAPAAVVDTAARAAGIATSVAKVHEYILVAVDGTCGVTKSNGPICFQQSRQEVGGHFEAYDPQLGDGYTAQVNEDGRRF